MITRLGDATLLCRPSFLVALQGYNLYQHRAIVCRFSLIVLPLLVRVRESTGVRYLWVLIMIIIISTFQRVPKGMEKGLKEFEIGRGIETIQTTDQQEYWEESWRSEETCCHLDSNGLKRFSRIIVTNNCLLCQKLKFDHTTKWYKRKSVQENETHKIIWDFGIQTIT